MKTPVTESLRKRPGARTARLALTLILIVAARPLSALPHYDTASLVAAVGGSSYLRSLPFPYQPGRLWLRDDTGNRLRRVLVELARRPNGRKMIVRIVASDFVTLLASTALRSGQAGLWGPMFYYGRPVGATIHVDLT